MKAFVNTEYTKQETISLITSYKDKGQFTLSGDSLHHPMRTGSAVQVMANGDYERMYRLYGIHSALAVVYEAIFGCLNSPRDVQFAVDFFQEMPIGCDTEKVFHHYMHWLVSYLFEHYKLTQMANVATVLLARSTGSNISEQSSQWLISEVEKNSEEFKAAMTQVRLTIEDFETDVRQNKKITSQFDLTFAHRCSVIALNDLLGKLQYQKTLHAAVFTYYPNIKLMSTLHSLMDPIECWNKLTDLLKEDH